MRQGLVSDLVRAVVGLVVTAVAAIVLGLIVLAEPLDSINISLFATVAEPLQDLPAAVEVSEPVTSVGNQRLDVVLLGVLGLVAAVRWRRVLPALVIVGSGPLMIVLQRIVVRVTDGHVPSGDLVIGPPGPFFSGGVMRLIVLAGLTAVVIGLRRTQVYSAALIAGIVMGVSRMVLGRHWPFDILAAIPIGLGVLWSVLTAVDAFGSQDVQERSQDVEPEPARTRR